MFVHLLPHSRVFFLTLLQTLYFSSNCLEWLKCCSLLNTSQHFSTLLNTSEHFSTFLNTAQHFRAVRGRSAKCSISEWSLKEAFEGESLSFFCSSSEKWGAQVQAPTLRMQCSKTTLLGELTTILVPSNIFGPFNYCWSFQLFLGPAINFQTSVGQSSQISTAVFYQNSSWSFWHTDAHTKQCFLCSFFLLQISCDYIWQLRQVLLVVCVCTYVCIAFDATCWNHSTYAGKSSNDRIAQIVQHMLKEKAQHEGWTWKGREEWNCIAGLIEKGQQ